MACMAHEEKPTIYAQHNDIFYSGHLDTIRTSVLSKESVFYSEVYEALAVLRT